MIRPVIAVFGGSFDPVHTAHVSVIQQLQARLKPEQVNVVPCHIPPHKLGFHATARDRMAMLARAFHALGRVAVDERELNCDKTSYSYHTLKQYREELGREACLTFVMGSDSWRSFHAWYRWQDIFALCNIAVVRRPGEYDALAPQQNAYFLQNQVAEADLAQHACGKIVMLATEEMDVASREVRARIDKGLSFDSLVPPAVADYIKDKGLYLTSLKNKLED